MNKNFVKNLSLWLLLGVFSGYLFLNLNQNDNLPKTLETTSPSVVNIWSLKNGKLGKKDRICWELKDINK